MQEEEEEKEKEEAEEEAEGEEGEAASVGASHPLWLSLTKGGRRTREAQTRFSTLG